MTIQIELPHAAPVAPTRLRLPPDQRIQQILDAALVVFSDRGFSATRMDDIAHGCGLSKGGLYAHFKSKEEVFNALLRRSLSPPELRDPGPNRPTTARQLAEWVVDGLYSLLASPQTVGTLRLLIAETERVPNLVELWYANVIKPHAAMLGKVLQDFAAQHGGTPSIITREPWLVMAPVLHPMLMRLTLGLETQVPLEHYRSSHVTMLCELLSPCAAGADAGRP